MKNLFTRLFLLVFLGAGALTARAQQQQPFKRCATDESTAELIRQNPAFGRILEQQQQMAEQYERQNAGKRQSQVVIRIPVVFHVVYSTATQNISNAQIMSQLDILNKDFRRMNADTMQAPAHFRALAGDTRIEFCLATVDPQGNPTTGITRTSTATTSFGMTGNPIKFTANGGINIWNRDKYLNIWIGNLTGGILGYAQLPGGSASTDGVVLLYTSVGAPPANPFTSAAPYNRGRTGTHEVGHWLGLQHIWGAAGCSNDDGIADTPVQDDENYGCPGVEVSCSNGPNGDMHQNYMDYTNDACMTLFTRGQGTRMNTILNTTRAAILTSNVCNNVVTANFTASSTTVLAGSTVNFNDASTGFPTSWSWNFGDPASGAANTSALQNPSHTFAATGTYTVRLAASNATSTDTIIKTAYINVVNTLPTCTDTVGFPLAGTPTIYRAGTGGSAGYVSGTNTYGDKAKAEQFVNNASTDITGGMIRFGVAKSASGSGTVTVAVWNSAGTAGSPGAIIASTTIPVSTIAANITANQYTTFTFPTPVTVTGNYYMGVQISNTPGDTIVVVTNRPGDSPAGRAWEQGSNNTWVTYVASWGAGANLAHYIFPIVSQMPSNPVASFTPSAATNICSGQTVTFNSGASTGASSFNWSFPGGTPATSTAANPTVTYNSAGTYNVTLVANGTCGQSSTLTRSALVTVGASPTVTIANSAFVLCANNPQPITITASGATTYSWTGPNGFTATGASITVTPTATSVYNVTGSNGGACSGTAVASVTVRNVVASFTASPDPVNLNNTNLVTFTNTTTSTQNPIPLYNWNFGDPASGAANTSPLQHPQHAYFDPGTYTVTLTVTQGGCSSTFTKQLYVDYIMGLQRALDKGLLKIYPNPAQNQLTIEATAELQVSEVVLTNAVGQQVKAAKAVTESVNMDLSDLANGIYFVRVTGKDGSITKKISIIK